MTLQARGTLGSRKYYSTTQGLIRKIFPVRLLNQIKHLYGGPSAGRLLTALLIRQTKNTLLFTPDILQYL